MKIAFVNDSSQGSGVQYLGVQHISAVLKAGGHQTKLFLDPQLFNDTHCSFKALSRFFDFKQHIIQELKEYQPGIIGFSVVTDLYPWACEMARLIKETMDVFIIFGGIHPSSVPERVIKNDFVDVVCIGEGEYPMLELVNSLESGNINYSIKNLWFKKKSKIIRNELRPLIENLNKLPFSDLSLYNSGMEFLKNGYYIAASRGCPNNCSYCFHSYFHELYKGEKEYVRRRSVMNVVNELIQARDKLLIKKVLFVDDCFGHDLNWLEKFSVEYKRKIDIPFCCIMQPADVIPEKVNFLKNAGCCYVHLGIQSWDKNLREKLLNRYVENSVMLGAIQLLKKAGIQVVVDNLMRLPGQNCEDLIRSNLQYAKIRPDRIFFYELRYYPKTSILEKALVQGAIDKERYEKILDGQDRGGLCIKGPFTKTHLQKNGFNKVKALLLLIDVIPERVFRFLVNRKIYRRIPSCLDMSVFMFFRTLFSRDIESRFRVYEAFAKYKYFIKKKLKLLIAKNNLKK